MAKELGRDNLILKDNFASRIVSDRVIQVKNNFIFMRHFTLCIFKGQGNQMKKYNNWSGKLQSQVLTINSGQRRALLDQCFPTFFGSRHPYLELKLSGASSSGFIRYKDQGIKISRGTPGTSSRHPGWELGHLNSETLLSCF